MPTARDPKQLLQAARLYYLDNHSQQEIADLMNTSRSNVSRMLAASLAQGIVEIRINDPAGREPELEESLKASFGLRDARVAHRGRGVVERVGVLASRLLLEFIHDRMTIAMSWGHTLQTMVWATTTDRDYDVQLVQLEGGLSALGNDVSGQELVRELASRLGANYRYLHAPAILDSSQAREALLTERSIVQSLDAARDADVAFVGIGTPAHGSSAAILSALDLAARDEKAFWAAQPAGDIAARYFDHAGRPVKGAVYDRVLGVDLDDIARIPTVVGVVHGRVKAPGVLGALRGHLIDVLVCDESLARSVLAPERNKKVDPT
jgi:DNA-binding transcriptional regulator LsrR (DeoR family)